MVDGFDFGRFYLFMNTNTCGQCLLGISSITAMLNIVLWPKRMGHETGTVYLKYSPEFGS